MERQDDEKIADQFSPKRVILLVQGAGKYLVSKWLTLLIVGLIFGILIVVYSYPARPVFTAEFSFAMDDGAVKNTNSNGATRLSEELGFSPVLEAGGVFSSMTNIMALMQSRLLIEKTLNRTAVPYEKPVLLINFFLDSLRLREKWLEKSKYPEFDFADTSLSRDQKIFRNGIMQRMYDLISTKMLKIDQKAKGSSLMAVTLSTENELFSKYFLEALVDEVSRYYIALKTYRAKTHLDFIQKRTDSVRTAYLSSLYGRAGFSDANVNPNLQINIVPGEKKQTDVLVLRETYIGLIRSLESARTSLLQDTPLFQYLDQPVLPLKSKSTSLIFRFIVFMIVGIFLAATVLIAVKFYRYLLSREN